MIIDIKDIRHEIGASLEFEGKLEYEGLSFQHEELLFPEPLTIRGSIVNAAEVLVLNASVQGFVSLECGLCTERYPHYLNFSFEARLNRTAEPDDPDMFVYQGDTVDLKDIVLEYLLLDLPIRRKCKEDCKGLCPVCGMNLNAGKCKCSYNGEGDPDQGIDERLKALKDYFSTQGKEV